MRSTLIEPQQPEPIDEATHAALDAAEVYFAKREGVTLDQAREEARRQYAVWQENGQR